MGRRTWIKIYTDKWLRGSIRKEDVMTRSIFIDLLALAGDSAYGDSGIIQLAEQVGLTDETISCMLNVPIYDWQKAKDRLANHKQKDENRIEIVELEHGYSIKIINWAKYQSEYQRQKPIRNRIKPAKVTSKVTESVTSKVTQKVQRDRERDIDRDIDGEGEKNIIIHNGDKPLVSKKRPNKKIQEVIVYAKQQGFPMQGSIKMNRQYIWNLLRSKDPNDEYFTVDAIKKLIDVAVASRGEPYVTHVNDFKQMYYKWADLWTAVEKKARGGCIG